MFVVQAGWKLQNKVSCCIFELWAELLGLSLHLQWVGCQQRWHEAHPLTRDSKTCSNLLHCTNAWEHYKQFGVVFCVGSSILKWRSQPGGLKNKVWFFMSCSLVTTVVWNPSCVWWCGQRRRRGGCVAVMRLLLHATPPGGKESRQICHLSLWQAKSCAEANLIWYTKATALCGPLPTWKWFLKESCANSCVGILSSKHWDQPQRGRGKQDRLPAPSVCKHSL